MHFQLPWEVTVIRILLWVTAGFIGIWGLLIPANLILMGEGGLSYHLGAAAYLVLPFPVTLYFAWRLPRGLPGPWPGPSMYLALLLLQVWLVGDWFRGYTFVPLLIPGLVLLLLLFFPACRSFFANITRPEPVGLYASTSAEQQEETEDEAQS